MLEEFRGESGDGLLCVGVEVCVREEGGEAEEVNGRYAVGGGLLGVEAVFEAENHVTSFGGSGEEATIFSVPEERDLAFL